MRGLRAALRISRRTAWRSKGRSALILAMLALPVAVITFTLTAFATLYTAHQGHYPLGRADALVQGARELSGLRQSAWGDNVSLRPGTKATPYTRAEIAGFLPGSRLIPVSQRYIRYLAPGGYEQGLVRQVDLRDPLSQGTFRLARGRLPTAPGEAVISAKRLDEQVRPGVTLFAAEERRPLRIVGVALFAQVWPMPEVVAFPGSLPDSGFSSGNPIDMTYSWLVDAPRPLSWADVRRLNARGLLVASRAVADSASASAPQYDLKFDRSTLPVLPWMGIALLQVVLAAGPAFTVGRRRRAREFALVAAQGGSPAQLRLIALADGLLFGVAGAAPGAVIGVVAVPLATPGLELWAKALVDPFIVPWTSVALVAVLGVVAGVLAALAPAVGAGRTDAAAVLSGRRERRRDRAGRPLLGAALVVAGLTATAASARHGVHWIAASALLTQLGLVALVPALVGAVGRAAARLPLPLRFAVRDAVRNRGRTAPAVAAVMTTVVVLTATGVAWQTSVVHASPFERGQVQGPVGSLQITARDLTPQLWDRVRAVVLRELPKGVPLVEGRALATKAGVPLGVTLPLPARMQSQSYISREGEYGGLLAGDEGLLRFVLGREDPEAVAALRAGKAVVLNPATIREGRITAQIMAPYSTPPDKPASLSFPAVGAPPTGQGWARVVVAPEVAEKQGYGTATTLLAVNPADYRTPQATADRITAAVEAVTPHAVVRLETPHGPVDDSVALLVLAAAAAVLVLGMTFVATALAAAEARPDLETMAAVGAAPRTKRAVVAGQALVIALLGTTIGVLAGLPPGVATARVPSGLYRPVMVLRSDGVPVVEHPRPPALLLTIPWPLIALLVVGLPLLAALGGAVFTRSRLPLPRRRVT
ncbi:FtsX-like permease family protein [Microbispora triticiradicis]|uniref:FtsX-like permease family protein n=1 Tax=Microbispora triticiradicis TaxID=2200763 RepID=UPI001AD7E271|nr:FtsX-like permease family protein [Microbispora triticiradicis]MBO4270471.1 ABC transporter permease [Microbispora triticiradicis]